jgi:hypothetical protein
LRSRSIDEREKMKRSAILRAIVAVLACGTVLAVEPAREQSDTEIIPLDRIWATHMPGTRDIRDLQPEQRQEKWDRLPPDEQRKIRARDILAPTVLSLGETSSSWPREGQIAKTGFAVAGTGLQALQEAHSVLVAGAKPSESFTPDDDITLVFFCYEFGSHVEIRKVERHDNDIAIHYRFVRPINKSLEIQLALIPIGRLSAEKYHVEVTQETTGQETLDRHYISRKPDPRNEQRERDWGRRFVSGSYFFSVVGSHHQENKGTGALSRAASSRFSRLRGAPPPVPTQARSMR